MHDQQNIKFNNMNVAAFHFHSSTMLSKHKLLVSSGKITRVTKFLAMFIKDPGNQSSWNVRNESLEVQLCILKVRSFILEPEASYSHRVSPPLVFYPFMRKNAGIMTSGLPQPLLPLSFPFHRSKFL